MVLRYVQIHRLGRGRITGITAVAFSPNGKYLASAALDGRARIWDAEDGQLLHMFSSTVPMLSLTWSENGNDTIMCGLNDGTICCLVIAQFNLEVMGFWAHSYPVECLRLKDGLLVSGAYEEVRIWKAHGEAWLQEAELQPPPKTSYNRVLPIVVTSVHWITGNGGQTQLVVTYLNHGVHIFNTTTWEQIRSVPIPGQIADASVSRDAKLIAISNVISGFDVYSIDSGTAVCSVGHTVTGYRKIPVLLAHDAVMVLGGNLQGDVHLWLVESGHKVHSLIHAKEDQILALAAHYDTSSDTFFIATGVLQGTSESAVVLWKAQELAPIHHGQTTILEFAAPSPRGSTLLPPTILATLDALNVVDARARPFTPDFGTPETLRAASEPVRDEKPFGILKSEPGVRALPVKTPSTRSPFRIEPVRSHFGRDEMSQPPTSTPPARRITRLASRSSMSSVANDAARDAREDSLYPQSDGTPARSSSRVSFATDDVSSDDDTRSESDLPYVKRNIKAWFETQSAVKILSPPLLQNQLHIRVGDVFCHKTPRSIQFWLSEVRQGAQAWRAVRMGQERADGRYLSVSEKKLEPSWVCQEWCQKRMAAYAKAVRFETGEASFSEEMPQNARSLRRRANPHPSIRSSVSTYHLLVGFVLAFAAILAYAPLPPIDAFGLAPRVARSTREIFSNIWIYGHEERQALESACTHAPDAHRNTVHDLALLARWGPVLRPDYALGAVGGRIVPSLTSPPLERTRPRSSISATTAEVVIDEELTIGRCWTTAATGQVGLSTPTLIYPQQVTIDHIPRQLALDIGRAPRRMVLWGVIDGLSNMQRFKSLDVDATSRLPFNGIPHGRSSPPLAAKHAFIALAVFEYDISGDYPTQTFAVFDHIMSSKMDFGIFVLEVVDNWGAPDTCLYRIRIHGEPAAIGSAEER
ncbi:Spindle pole body-associated protein sad1 [Trametes pubescens]|uniref:Spindle pole body-associated protein sad1 n=1 Tax=Trametes pubescens TaxID=154538 RepID=A0A1M2W5I3_TRAPU|nr:Spindle pole body-associated protein sad1 [Trametes pubescens]